MFEIRIDIPALDRLCDVLEKQQTTASAAIFTPKNDAAAVPETEVKKETAKKTKAQNAKETAVEKPVEEKPAEKPAEAPKAVEKPAPAAPIIPIENIMKAAREICKDAEKRVYLTGEVFRKFGIEKISDLKAESINDFAETLRSMGGEI